MAIMHSPLPPGMADEGLKADLKRLSDYLENWEFSDSRKFAIQYTQKWLLDRHLGLADLRSMEQARKIVNRRTKSLPDYITDEKRLLEKARDSAPADTQQLETVATNTIISLRSEPTLSIPDELKRLLSQESLERLDRINDQLNQRVTEAKASEDSDARSSHAILIEDLIKDKQGILEIALRNARLERIRVQKLLDYHEQGRHDMLQRPYLDEEELVLQNYLSEAEVDEALEVREQIAAHLVEEVLLARVKKKAENDVVDLLNLLNRLDRIDRDLDEETKITLRDNMLTLRNSRFRNIQSRVEKIAQISATEYNRKITVIEQAISLQDLFNRYYTSLFITVDLSSQSDKFGVFNKGWFYDQQPEFVLRREFASIGNKLAAYAEEADFGVRVQKLWTFTDDQIRQAVMSSQWSVASGIEAKELVEGKSLETLIGEHYETLVGLSGVSRLMKMQFEQMRNQGEPSEDMLKDMDYIRKEVERFIRNDLRTARKNRKNKIRLLNRLNSMLALRHEDASALTQDEIEDIKTLIGIAGLGGQTNFVNAISASGGKTWKTYIPGKIAFDSEGSDARRQNWHCVFDH